MIRQGKGRKDRMIPIGARALTWIRRYVDEVRPHLVREPDPGTLFLTNLFEPFTPNRLTQLVRDLIDKADLAKRGSCHLFRHTCASATRRSPALAKRPSRRCCSAARTEKSRTNSEEGTPLKPKKGHII